MATLTDDITDQLLDEVAAVTSALGPLLGPQAALDLDMAIKPRVRHLAAELAQDGDDRLAGEATLTVMTLLWPSAAPEDCGQAEWWRTPVGRLCARSLGHDSSDAVTYSVAAAMLGVPSGSVGPWVQRGKLERHPDGGVTRASVLLRLADG